MTRLFRRLVPFLLLFLLVTPALPAQAHGYIIRSVPQDRAELDRPPTRLQYWFSEALEPRFSELNLRDANGQIIATGEVSPDDSALLRLQVPTDLLTDGAYIVELRPAFASDGHVVASSQVFFVGDAVGDVVGSAASDQPILLEIVWKALLFIGSSLLFGVYAVYAYALVPAWGNPKYPAGLLPPRLMRRLNWLVWLNVGLIAIALIVAMIQQSMAFFNVGAEQVISGGLWQVVRIGSRFGDVWNARVFFLIVIIALHGASLYYRRQFPRSVRAFWSANVWVMALFIGAQAVNSHAAGSLIWPWMAIIMHWLHAVAVAFWVGGVVILALILPVALSPYEGATRQAALIAVMRRFSRLTVGAVLVVITTGIYNAANWFYTPDDITTTYGGALGVKLIMVGFLLIVGAVHHVALRPHLIERLPLRGLFQRVQGFVPSLRLEAVGVVFALITAAILSSTPLPEPEFARQTVNAPTAETRVDDVTVNLSIVPGGPGVNTFDAVVRRDETIVSAEQVRLQVVDPQADIRTNWDVAEPIDAGLYVTANDAITDGGQWWTLLDITTADDETIRAAFEWNIDASASVIQSQPAGLTTIGALIAVILSVGYVLTPTFRRWMTLLDLSPVTLLVAFGAVILTVVTIIGAIIVVEQQQTAFQATLNPPPAIVNPTLPSAESIARGANLFTAACEWQNEADYAALTNQVDILRDDVLFSAVRDGWRDLPACSADVTADERWDMVNYLRTLGR